MKALLKFRCHECDELHDDAFEANNCCDHFSETWVCASCGSENWSQSEGDDCCPADEPESPESIRQRLAELEAAGQGRLLP